MLTLHRKYSGVSKEPVLYVAENGKAKELKASKARAWLDAQGKKTRLLSTSAHSSDAILLTLVAQGAQIFTAHWHGTGIDKGLEPADIAAKFSLLDEATLRPYVPRPDLAELRALVLCRNAVLDYRKAATSQLGAAIRSLGISEDRLPKFATVSLEELEADSKPIEAACAKEVIKKAEHISDCRIFTKVFGMKAVGVLAAQFVSAVGDMSRFPSVASFWHYLGQHVVDGHAPKRKRGAVNDWNPEARTALWNIIDVGLKNNSPVIRAMYEKYKAAELAVRDQKCPDCATKLGHCGARARRKVTKELLKHYYVAAGGQGNKCAVAASA